VTEQPLPLSKDEFTVLEAIVSGGGDLSLATIAQWLSVEAAQIAVADLLGRGLVGVDRVDELPEGQTVDRAVSALTPSVRSTSREEVSQLSAEEAAVVIADPRSWLPGVHTTTWFEAVATAEAEPAYYAASDARRD
jgi:hypothetical protein